jgi:hypothetical protein
LAALKLTSDPWYDVFISGLRPGDPFIIIYNRLF